MFTHSREREIRQFHVVAVQQRQINVQISVNVQSFVLLIQTQKPIAFDPFSMSSSLLLKLRNGKNRR